MLEWFKKKKKNWYVTICATIQGREMDVQRKLPHIVHYEYCISVSGST